MSTVPAPQRGEGSLNGRDKILIASVHLQSLATCAQESSVLSPNGQLPGITGLETLQISHWRPSEVQARCKATGRVIRKTGAPEARGQLPQHQLVNTLVSPVIWTHASVTKPL